MHLLEHCSLPVLRLRHGQAGTVAARLAQAFPTRIRRASDVKPTILIDGKDFTVSPDHQLLIDSEHEWFVDVTAAVLELRATRFVLEALTRYAARLHGFDS